MSDPVCREHIYTHGLNTNMTEDFSPKALVVVGRL